MKRSEEHVAQFLFAELGTTGSVDGSRRLVIKGKYLQKQIENVLRRYIGEWTCLERVTVQQLTRLYSRVRVVQDLQVAEHGAGSRREPSVLHRVQQLRVSPQCAVNQDRFLSTDRQASPPARLSGARHTQVRGRSWWLDWLLLWAKL